MKKVVLSIMMSGLMAIGLMSMGPGGTLNSNTCNDACKPGGFADGWFSSYGVCMSSCNVCLNNSFNALANSGGNANATEAPCICLQAEDQGWNPYDNIGQCVTAVLNGDF